MHFGVRTLIFFGASLLVPAALWSQGRSIEVGIDGGLSVYLDDRTTTETSVPIRNLRFGWFASDVTAGLARS